VSAILEPLVGAPVRLTELKHKPGRRRVVRATGSRRTAIVKVYESERAPVVAARLAALAYGPPEPRVPRVLHLDTARRLLVLSEVEGEPLRAAILAGDLAACARVGRVLATWHRAGRALRSDALRPHAFADEARILLERAASAPAPIAEAVRAELPRVRGAWPCPTVVHRDLYEEQILLGCTWVGLIDLDDAALGPPELDLGNLLAHLELLELRCDGDYWLEATALLDGYDAPLERTLLDRCRRLTLLRLACIHGLPELVERARVAHEAVRA
jgi:Ser/Thr protein kinase RdoA (MazF antagonist)